MSTVFTRIIEGEIPGAFVHRDDQCVAFLSINPLAPGHTLVVPIAEIDHWIDMPSDLAAHVFDVAHQVGRALQAVFQCERVGLIVAGYEVPHAHVHVVPTTSMRQLDFANAAGSVDRDDLDQVAGAIRSALTRPDGAARRS